MARDTKPARTESLTIRLDPKTRFILEFVSRARGQTITTVVERAIIESASNVSLRDGSYRWQDLWDVSEGIRSLKIAKQTELYPSFDEEQILAFADAHEIFFFVDKKNEIYKRPLIDIIWPKIQEFFEYWKNNKGSDYFGAGRKMAAAVRSAGVEPPLWPPGATKKSARMNDVIDDDVPF